MAAWNGPRHLHPKVKIAWFAPIAVALFVLWMLATAFLVMTPTDWIPESFPKLYLPAITLAIIILFIALPIYAYLHMEYKSFTYELTDTEVVIREGLFTRKTVVIPYMRIQNINTRRTVLERLIGLASLQIETAGANPGASEGILPGISNKEALISEILGKVEKAKKTQGDGGLGGFSPTGQKSEFELLSDILKELVQLNKTINAHYGKGFHHKE